MSKLNPQKASAYVGPSVLRKGGKITKVPNGPLVKKKGPYAGSTLKAGGTIKKAQDGEYLTKEGSNYTSTKKVKTNNGPRYYQGKSSSMSFSREIASDKARKINDSIPKAKLSARALEVMNQKNGGSVKKAQNGEYKIGKKIYTTTKAANDTTKEKPYIHYVDNPMPPSKTKKTGIDALIDRASRGYKNGGMIKRAQNGTTTTVKTTKKPIPTGILPSKQRVPGKSKPYTDKQKDSLIDSWMKKVDTTFIKKNGGMIKRADGSMSKRGLWDNIRANKGSGKKPTKQMLVQEKKIKAKSKK